MQTSHEVMWICLTCVSKGSDTKIDIALQLYTYFHGMHIYIYSYICYSYCCTVWVMSVPKNL